MSAIEKVFRIFVSSTFADMVGERTMLQERVFPRLEAYCRERGGRFQAIDLRWGVSSRAARDRRTMSICLEEIRRCREVSPSLNFLVLLGTSGSGKSSVMARAALDAAARGQGAVVVSRFVGATPDTADIELLLRGICTETGRAYGDVTVPPSAYHELEKAFHQRIAAASPTKPLHIFIDGLDQIDMRDAGPLMPWLPRRLPDAVKLVVSVLDDPTPAGDRLRTLRGLLPDATFVPLEPLPKADADRVLDVWLDEAGRTLQPDQRSEVLRGYAGWPVPLFLRVAFEQARLCLYYSGLHAASVAMF